jgi:hypothetical protein
VTEVEHLPASEDRLFVTALASSALGLRKEADAALAEMIGKYAKESAYDISAIYASRGDTEKSFQWLDRAYAQQDDNLSNVKIDPLFKNLHTDPRWSALLEKMRLPV